MGRPGIDAVDLLASELAALKGPINNDQESELRKLAARLDALDQRLTFGQRVMPQKCGVFHAKGTRRKLV